LQGYGAYYGYGTDHAAAALPGRRA
jgi:hypothetical protein